MRLLPPWRRLLPFLPALLFVPMVLAAPLNQDVAGVLQFSQRWLAGERLYVDLIDVNPPLIFVLNLIPAALASVSPLGGVTALRLCLLAYGGLCWWLAMQVRDRRAEGKIERAFVDVLPALFLFGAGYDFGQREHLMVMAALPYALSAAQRAHGEVPRARVAVSLLAGIGFALKPHFLGVPALIELYVVCTHRTLNDPAPWFLGMIWAVYLASLPLVFPDYLGSVMPLVWGLYLDLGGSSVWQVLISQRLGTVMVLLAPLLFIAWRGRAELPRVLALAAVAALAAAIVQHKGWSYHILPAHLFACALGGVLAACWFDRQHVAATARYSVAAALSGLFALYAIANGESPWRELSYPGSDAAIMADLLQRIAAHGRVLPLSPDVYPVYPALNYADARSTLPAMSTWLLQGFYPSCLDTRRYRDIGAMGPSEAWFYHHVADDFSRAPPDAVLVDSNAGIPWCDGPFDFIAYFSRDLDFANAWSRYRLAAEWSHYRLYTERH